MGRLLQGRIDRPRVLLAWIAACYGTAFVLGLIAVLLFPAGNDFHILRSCVSNLGSPDREYNPSGFLYFCAALAIFGLAMIPIMLLRHRRMSAALGTPRRMRILTGAYLAGALCFALTGIFPMSRVHIFGDTTWDDVHDMFARNAFILIGAGVLIDGILILREGSRHRRGRQALLDYRRLRWPYILVTSIAACAVFFLLSWDMKRARDPTLRWTGEGLYAFALWEWLMTAIAPVAVAWIGVVWVTDRGPPPVRSASPMTQGQAPAASHARPEEGS